MILCVVIITGVSHNLSAQIYRMGGGLCFASGFQYNASEIGNPGFKVKTWIALDKRSTIHIVPTITIFNRNLLDAGAFTISNYMSLPFQTICTWEMWMGNLWFFMKEP